MFVVTEFKDTVRVPPTYFSAKLNAAIADELNRKLANKVLPNVGLCVSLHGITKLEESYIFPGDGASFTKVQFQYVVFRPFLDEVLTGKIKSCSHDGVHVTVGFFDDIIIPQSALQHPSRFDETEQIWLWEYESEGSTHQMFMDIGEEIRFRVVDEVFVDTTPAGPKSTEPSDTMEEKKVPYTIIGSASEPGLGLLSWWTS